MCTVLLPPGGYPFAVNKYIISYISCEIIEDDTYSNLPDYKRPLLPSAYLNPDQYHPLIWNV